MAAYFLDTHTLLWAHTEEHRVSARVREIITDQENVIFISAASVWEIFIKHNLGKLPLPDLPRKFIERVLGEGNCQPMPINFLHVYVLATLANHHRDPFDRLIICQAISEKIPILTSDPMMRKYDVNCIW